MSNYDGLNVGFKIAAKGVPTLGRRAFLTLATVLQPAPLTGDNPHVELFHHAYGIKLQVCECGNIILTRHVPNRISPLTLFPHNKTKPHDSP